MTQTTSFTSWRFLTFVLASILVLVAPVHAATTWTDWTSFTASSGTSGNGSAAGSVGGVGVTYSGELLGSPLTVVNGTSTIWSPSTSFVGGTVTASPSVVGDDLALAGNFTGTNTITFASPVTNPLFAIWSLGSGIEASFTFNATPTFEAGGPNSQFGGGPIVVNGNTVSGHEGNGVVQFTGTLSSISWTDTPEFFYAFTVGVNGPTSAVPEPMTLLLLGSGLAGLGALRFRRSRSTE
jgi:PEP-CTERM motif